ncbi:hypothetical protein GCM10017776_23900 [Streptomyces griseoluteus]|nr:hypothetical protein GCM10017776_23900 [Streptomyces griseoluteus]
MLQTEGDAPAQREQGAERQEDTGAAGTYASGHRVCLLIVPAAACSYGTTGDHRPPALRSVRVRA